MSLPLTVRRSLIASLAAAAAAASLGAGDARAAGLYHHQACQPGTTEATADAFGGWQPFMANVAGLDSVDRCGHAGLHTEVNPISGGPVGIDAGWRYTAPASTTLTAVSLSWGGWTRPFDGQTRGLVQLRGNNTGLLVDSSGETVWPTVRTVSTGLAYDNTLTWRVMCDGPGGYGCPGGSTAWTSVFAPRVTLSDDNPPSVTSAFGTATTDTTWKGTESLAYAASDVGGGVARLRLTVDGDQTVDRVIDEYGGRCRVLGVDGGSWIFGHPKPCPGSVNDLESIDTTALPDGQHTVVARVLDAGQRESIVMHRTVLVANHPPVNTATPPFENAALASSPVIGQPLVIRNHGAWSGPTLTYVEGWQRCDTIGASCAQIPGATTLAYTPTANDVGHTLRYAVTATNAADSVSAYSILTGVVTAPSSATGPVLQDPDDGSDGSHGSDGGNGTNGSNGSNGGTTIVLPGLPSATTTIHAEHVFVGHIVGEPAGTTCPQDKATLVFQHIKGGRMTLRYGKASTAQLALTCSANGKAIADAKLEIATKTGSQPVVAADVTTDGAGHATLRLAQGASRGVTVGYRMYADDPLARATATLKVLVAGRVAVKADRRRLRNGQPVRLTGKLAGGHVPKRGVTLSVQWRDGKRWRPFAQIKTDRKGAFRYAYKFIRTNRKVVYRLRIQVVKGQIDYPFEAAVSKTVKVTVAP